jgi:hypothetical protein
VTDVRFSEVSKQSDNAGQRRRCGGEQALKRFLRGPQQAVDVLSIVRGVVTRSEAGIWK